MPNPDGSATLNYITDAHPAYTNAVTENGIKILEVTASSSVDETTRDYFDEQEALLNTLPTNIASVIQSLRGNQVSFVIADQSSSYSPDNPGTAQAFTMPQAGTTPSIILENPYGTNQANPDRDNFALIEAGQRYGEAYGLSLDGNTYAAYGNLDFGPTSFYEVFRNELQNASPTIKNELLNVYSKLLASPQEGFAALFAVENGASTVYGVSKADWLNTFKNSSAMVQGLQNDNPVLVRLLNLANFIIKNVGTVSAEVEASLNNAQVAPDLQSANAILADATTPTLVGIGDGSFIAYDPENQTTDIVGYPDLQTFVNDLGSLTTTPNYLQGYVSVTDTSQTDPTSDNPTSPTTSNYMLQGYVSEDTWANDPNSPAEITEFDFDDGILGLGNNLFKGDLIQQLSDGTNISEQQITVDNPWLLNQVNSTDTYTNQDQQLILPSAGVVADATYELQTHNALALVVPNAGLIEPNVANIVTDNLTFNSNLTAFQFSEADIQRLSTIANSADPTGAFYEGGTLPYDDSTPNANLTPRLFDGNDAVAAGTFASFDTNNDGVINSSDADYNDLQVWEDLNQNGVLDSGEMQTLAQAGITSISDSDFALYTAGNANYALPGRSRRAITTPIATIRSSRFIRCRMASKLPGRILNLS